MHRLTSGFLFAAATATASRPARAASAALALAAAALALATLFACLTRWTSYWLPRRVREAAGSAIDAPWRPAPSAATPPGGGTVRRARDDEEDAAIPLDCPGITPPAGPLLFLAGFRPMCASVTPPTAARLAETQHFTNDNAQNTT